MHLPVHVSEMNCFVAAIFCTIWFIIGLNLNEMKTFGPNRWLFDGLHLARSFVLQIENRFQPPSQTYLDFVLAITYSKFSLRTLH